ncbi:hypothetical protein [Streptomyces lydicus]|uniref:hypothetical protein n=1 Tax=Streptomyces lydicus TaxID=47763 RepID=UPI003317326E
MPDITEILKRARPRERSVTLCLAGDEAAEVERLERQMAELSDTWQPDNLGAKNPAEALAKRIRAARERMRKSETEFTFRAMGDKAWSDLIAAHPGGKGQSFDPETFPKALVAAACVDPVMTADQTTELFEVLNQGQRDELWQAAFEVNTESTSVPFSVSASAMLSSLSEGK